MLTRRRRIAIATICLLAVSGAAFCLNVLRQRQDHHDWYRDVECQIQEFASRRPREVSKSQWALCLTHTWNLHANYGGFHHWDRTSREEFKMEFVARLKGKVGLKTIDWFWDAYAAAVPRARGYLRYRPTLASWLKDAPHYDLDQWPVKGRTSNCEQLLQEP